LATSMTAFAASTVRLALGTPGRWLVMPKFVYLIHLTDGRSIRVETAGDPTSHPSLAGRVLDVETLGEAGLRLVSDPHDKVYA
jgi:hypothetical protein